MRANPGGGTSAFLSALLWALGAGAALGSDFAVIISEVHHNPAGGDAAGALEYLELCNTGLSDVDLSGWSFTEGISFEFPPGTSIRAGAYRVLSPEPAAAQSHYGIQGVLGPYGGRLDNGGEVVSLVNRAGLPVNRIHYDDEGSWPSLPDGLGPSLEFTGGDVANDLAYRWAPSVFLGGTPGRQNSRREGPSGSAEENPHFLRGAINEIKPSGVGADAGFIELYNPADGPLDLSGHVILFSGGESFALPAGTTLSSGALRAFGDSILGFSVPAREDICVLLEEDGLTLVDAVEVRSAPAGHSFGRFPDGGEDTFVMTSPTGGSPNTYGFVSPLVINEIYFHPPYVPPGPGCSWKCSDVYQWLEIWNRSDAQVDLSGWSLSKGLTFSFPSGLTLAAGDGVVVAADVQKFRQAHPGVELVLGPWSGRLSHSSDTINLRDPLGNRADHVKYGDGRPLNDEAPVDGVDDRTFRGSPWPSEADGSGRSLELLNPAIENQSGFSWRASTASGGTPGAINSVFAAEPGPIVENIRHEPLVPTSSDFVTVTCRIKSLSPVSIADLEWAPDGQALRTARLRDDGVAPDVVKGDGEYGAFIPNQPDGQVVMFRIRAADSLGNVLLVPPAPSVKPYAGFHGPYYLYEVDDQQGPGNRSPTYRIVMTERDRDELQDRNLASNVLLPVTFICGAEVRHVAGLRFRGETSRREENRSYRINFASEALFDGIEHLNLNGSNGGSGLGTSNVREILACELFRRAGAPYPQTFPVNVHFPGEVARDFDSRYVRKENFDEEFLTRCFGGSDDGNLYRGMNPGGVGSENGDLSYLGEDPEPYEPLYEKRSNEEENDYSDLIELTRAFDPAQTPKDLFAGEIASVLDPNEWAFFFAAQDVLRNVDGGIWTDNGEDYFLYHVPAASARPDADRFLILPWDLEESLGDNNDPLFLASVRTVRRFLTEPKFTQLYYAQVSRLKGGLFSRPEIHRSLEFVKRMFAPADVPSVMGTMEAFVEARVGYLDENLPRGLQAGAISRQASGTELIVPGDTWRFFRGWQSPSGDPTRWRGRTFDDAFWESGPTGIGYGDGDDATTLNDMQGNYTTVFARKTFPVADPAAVTLLQLVIDYDDAFVAYVNGSEIARSDGAPGDPGDPVLFNDTSGSDHEAGNPETFDFFLPSGLLVAGTNVLAIVALNGDADSSDFSMIPTLIVQTAGQGGGVAGGCGGPIHAVGSEVVLGGDVDPALARSVTVDGALAKLEYVTGGSEDFGARWSATVSIALGDNRILVQAHPDANGLSPPTIVKEVLVRRLAGSFTAVSGTLAGDVEWTPAGGPYRVVGQVDVPAGSTLTVQPGTAVVFNQGAGIVVRGLIRAQGTAAQPISFDAFHCGEPWAAIALTGTGAGAGSPLHIFQHCNFEFARGPSSGTGVIFSSGSRFHAESCAFRSLETDGVGASGSTVQVQDSLFEDVCYGIRASATAVTLLDSSFARLIGNRSAVEIAGDGATRSILERCTVEDLLNDGVVVRAATADIRECEFRGVIEDALYVSGAGSFGAGLVTESVFHDCGTGLEILDEGEVEGDHITVTGCREGVYVSATGATAGGGRGSFHSAIVWGNETDAILGNSSALSFSFSNVGGGPWPGEANIDAGPSFVGGGDLSLAPGSPCIATGKDGTDMGAIPYGGGVPFIRGDTNGTGKVDISDAIVTLNYLFMGGDGPSCLDSCDANDDGRVDITDPVFTLNFLFLGGRPIPAPYPTAGADPTPDSLACDV